MVRLLIATAAAACITTAVAAPPDASSLPDYSHVTTLEVADRLVSEGKLFKILLLPKELGGEELPNNTAYVPATARQIHDEVNGELVELQNDGRIDQVAFTPERKGKSLVPSKIFMLATHSTRRGNYVHTLDIW